MMMLICVLFDMCLSPITFNDTRSGNHPVVRTVPCGCCLECVSAFQNSWSIRLGEESKCWKFSAFVTLKYCDQRIPLIDVCLNPEQLSFVNKSLSKLFINCNLNDPRRKKSEYRHLLVSSDVCRTINIPCKRDLQNFVKRVRIAIKRRFSGDSRLKYFISTEYGPSTLRTHAHCLFFFNFPFELFQEVVREVWVSIASLPDASTSFQDKCIDISLCRDSKRVANYVSKYCCKPAAFENPYVVVGLAPRCFRLISKGIGLGYALDLSKRVKALYAEYGLPYNEQFSKNGTPYNANQTFSIPFSSKRRLSYSLLDNFYNELDSIFTYSVSGKYGVYHLRSPRYFRDLLFPQKDYPLKTFQRVSSDNSQLPHYEIVYKFQRRKNTESDIYCEFVDWRDRRSHEKYLEKLSDYLFAGLSRDAAELRVLADEKADLQNRFENKLRSFTAFYRKKTAHRGYYGNND